MREEDHDGISKLMKSGSHGNAWNGSFSRAASCIGPAEDDLLSPAAEAHFGDYPGVAVHLVRFKFGLANLPVLVDKLDWRLTDKLTLLIKPDSRCAGVIEQSDLVSTGRQCGAVRDLHGLREIDIRGPLRRTVAAGKSSECHACGKQHQGTRCQDRVKHFSVHRFRPFLSSYTSFPQHRDRLRYLQQQVFCQDAVSHGVLEFQEFVKWRMSKCLGRRQISDVKAEIWLDAVYSASTSETAQSS